MVLREDPVLSLSWAVPAGRPAFRWASVDPFLGVLVLGGEGARHPAVPSASQPAAGASRWAPAAEPSVVAVPGTSGEGTLRGTAQSGAAILTHRWHHGRLPRGMHHGGVCQRRRGVSEALLEDLTSARVMQFVQADDSSSSTSRNRAESITSATTE